VTGGFGGVGFEVTPPADVARTLAECDRAIKALP
jgi:hypothetical protein